MKIDKSNALEFANKFIKRAKALSDSVKFMLETEKKHKIKSNYDYKSDLAEIDKLILLANKSMKILKQPLPGYSFAENNESTITKIQIRESVVSVAKQLKSISDFLLKMIAKETQQLIDKDYSLLLKKIEAAMKLVNGEVKIYKDESTWLLAEGEIDYGNNGKVRNQIGFKVPMLGRLVDALEFQLQKESKENSAIDHTKLLINLAASLKSFDDDMKEYRSDPNAPVIQTNKLLNKLTSSSLAFKGNYQDVYGLAGITVDEFSVLMSESDINIPNKLPEDRNELHKLILAVKEKQNVSYDEALQILRGKK